MCVLIYENHRIEFLAGCRILDDTSFKQYDDSHKYPNSTLSYSSSKCRANISVAVLSNTMYFHIIYGLQSVSPTSKNGQ